MEEEHNIPKQVYIRKKGDPPIREGVQAKESKKTADMRESIIRIGSSRRSRTESLLKDKKETPKEGEAGAANATEQNAKKAVQEDETVAANPPAIGSADLSEPMITASQGGAKSEQEGIEPAFVKEPNLLTESQQRAEGTEAEAKETESPNEPGQAGVQDGTGIDISDDAGRGNVQEDGGPEKNDHDDMYVGSSEMADIPPDPEAKESENRPSSDVKPGVGEKKPAGTSGAVGAGQNENVASKEADGLKLGGRNITEGRAPDARDDTEGKVQDTRDDREGKVPDTRDDTDGKVPDARDDREEKVPDARDDTEGKVPDGGDITDGNVPEREDIAVGKVPEGEGKEGGKEPEGENNTGKKVREGEDNAGGKPLEGEDNAGGKAPEGEDNAAKKALEGEDNAAKKALEGEDNAGGKPPEEEDNAGGKAPEGEDNTGGKLPEGEDKAGRKVPEEEDSTGGKAPEGEDNAGGKLPEREDKAGGKAPKGEDKAGSKVPDVQDITGGKVMSAEGYKSIVKKHPSDGPKKEGQGDPKGSASSKQKGSASSKQKGSASSKQKGSASSKQNIQIPIMLERSKPSENFIGTDRKSLVRPGIFILKEKEDESYEVKFAIPEKILAYNVGAKVSGRFSNLTAEIEDSLRGSKKSGDTAKTSILSTPTSSTRKSTFGSLRVSVRDMATNTETASQPENVDYYRQYYDPQTVPWPHSSPGYYSSLGYNANNPPPWNAPNHPQNNSSPKK